MSRQATNPRQPQAKNAPARKVNNIRGKTVDKMTEVQHQTNNYEPHLSIYDQDYNKKNKNTTANKNEILPTLSDASRKEIAPEENRAQTVDANRKIAPNENSKNSRLNNSAMNNSKRIGQSDIKTNGKWAWVEKGSPDDIEDLVPEDWCCVDKDPRSLNDPDAAKKHKDFGYVFPKYVNWGNPNQKSLYQRDYVPHELPTKLNGPNTNPWTTFYSNEPMDMGTCNRNDFKPYQVGPPEKFNPDKKYKSIKAPFPGQSFYKNDYINYGAGMPPRNEATNIPTIISELPFIGKTNNGEYGNFPFDEGIKPDQTFNSAHKSMFKNPLGPDIPMLCQSTMQGDFKPFKISKNQQGPKGSTSNDPTPNYMGQYNSVYKKDYCCGRYRRCPDCPLRKELNETLKTTKKTLASSQA